MDHDVSVEMGRLTATDPAYDIFNEGNGIPSFGARGTFAVHDRIGITAGWHRARRGSDVYSQGSGELRAALRLDEITLGARSELEVGDALRPYVEVDALLLRGAALFDDDASRDDNPGQVRRNALAPGFLALGGVALRVPEVEGPVMPSFHLAMGWGTTLMPLAWEDIGELTPRGFVVRLGGGVRF
jgi:hypothetical protein